MKTVLKSVVDLESEKEKNLIIKSSITIELLN